MEQEQVSCRQKVNLKSATESIPKVEKFVDEVCDEHEIGEASYGNILIAITEAVNNAIQHGNAGEPSKNFTVSYQPHEDLKHLVFTIRDKGQGFDFDHIPDPTAPENLEKPYGRGIFLMRNLADEVNFYEEGSVVELKFNIQAN